MRIHYLQHVPFEGLGSIATWADTRGHSITRTRLFRQEPLPDPSEFDWQYSSTEVAYVKKGRVIVTEEGGEEVEIKTGDLVTFPKGMKCRWKVLERIEKVYTFI